jgi:hypothetical protein
MPASAFQVAQRALVKLLLSLAQAYQVVLAINRDSAKAAIQKAFRKVSVKVHPDKGGSTTDFQRLTVAQSGGADVGVAARAAAPPGQGRSRG